jgi:hypothetical protein
VRVWRVVAAWMLVCCFKAARGEIIRGKFEAEWMFEGEVFIHRWMDGRMDGRVGLDLFLTQPGMGRRIGLDESQL